MSKFKIYNSTGSNTSVCWDIDSSIAFPSSMQHIYDPFIPKPPNPQRQDYLPRTPEIYDTPIQQKEEFILVVLSQPYPINIQYRSPDILLQPNIVNYPNVPLPSLQFVEDIIIKGKKITKFPKSSLRRDNDESKLTNLDTLFYNFLQQKQFFSLRNFILATNKFTIVKPKKKTYTFESISDNNIYKAHNYLNNFLSQSNLAQLAIDYEFEILSAVLMPPVAPSPDATPEEIAQYEERLSKHPDYFDYDTTEVVTNPSSLHIPNMWKPQHLSQDNILSLYNRAISINLSANTVLSSNVFVQFKNLFPNIVDYNNPLLIQITSISTATISYSYVFPLGNRTTTGIFTVNNPQVCFVGSRGIIRQFNINGQLVKYFYPDTRKYLCTITAYSVDTGNTTITVLGQSYTTLVYNNKGKTVNTLNEDGDPINGLLEIADNFTLHFTTQ